MAAGMKNKLGFVIIVLMVCLVALSKLSSAATSHTVGDSSGWTIPSPSSLYSNWASKQTFKVGDTLVFNFVPGTHTVAEVTKADYDSCTTNNGALSPDTTDDGSKIQISTPGTHYYICTIPEHCRFGQKVAINANSATPTTPSPSATSSSVPPADAATSPVSMPPSSKSGPSSSATPPSNSAVTLVGGGLVLPLLLVGVAFLF